jgi:hypothetical protein
MLRTDPYQAALAGVRPLAKSVSKVRFELRHESRPPACGAAEASNACYWIFDMDRAAAAQEIIKTAPGSAPRNPIVLILATKER